MAKRLNKGTAKRRANVQGVVDFASPNRVTGWARDFADPSARLTVWVEVNGVAVGGGVADLCLTHLFAASQG
jgi:hypothetical protein